MNLYRDRAATYCVATVLVSAPHAPTRKHTTFNHLQTNRFGKLVTTSFALEWIMDRRARALEALEAFLYATHMRNGRNTED